MDTGSYAPKYEKSWALVIGIDGYTKISPLSCACNDAQAISKILIEKFEFPKENVKLLLNLEATKEAIESNYLANSKVGPDDRVLMFFAGHGYTHPVPRGNIGFLIPVHGHPNNIASLIGWDFFVKNSELIPAKHIFFIMDACYGGTAFTRSASPGSMRFLNNMLQRYSRQCISSGKADELVSDANGPLSGHSIFTGHLIEGLNGKAKSNEGILTGTDLMSYVYKQVSKDLHSTQTPHYGHLYGDGDFIFEAPILTIDTETGDNDILFSIPIAENETEIQESTLIQKVKQYLSEPTQKINLHDLISQELRKFKIQTSNDSFPVTGIGFKQELVVERIKQYEAIVNDLLTIISCISYWGNDEHRILLRKILAKPCEQLSPRDGLAILLNLRYYPMLLLFYISGISAITVEHYDNLFTIFNSEVESCYGIHKTNKLFIGAKSIYLEFLRSEIFKTIPGYDKYYTPISEYLYKLLQPILEDLFFLGEDYETAFDKFEIFQALVNVDYSLLKEEERTWGGPYGRFAWKYKKYDNESDPVKNLIGEARTLNHLWPPFKAGFFGGSLNRFEKVAKAFTDALKQLNWH